MDPNEPFTCEAHRGYEKHPILALVALIECPRCNARSVDAIRRTGEAFAAVVDAATETEKK